MTEFDPIKAAREELTGLVDVLVAIQRRENAAEIAIAEAESELNAIRKVRGYCQVQIVALKDRIATMEAQHD